MSSKQKSSVVSADVAAVWTQAAALHGWLNNPRRNDAAVPNVVESIKRFGWAAPLLARSDNGEIVAGHTRMKAHEALRAEYVLAKGAPLPWHPDALRAAEHDQVPVRFGNWSEADAHLLAIADNKLNEIAEWDEAAVAALLAEYQPIDVTFLTIQDDTILFDAIGTDYTPRVPVGVTQVDVDAFTYAHTCPKCKFGFNDYE